jgi:hypothetical protein
MLFVLICTEGEVSEPEYLKAIGDSLRGQAPQLAAANVEVIPVPLGGNQGYNALIDKANQEIAAYFANPDNCIEDSDTVEKWLVCDYDDIEKSGVNIDDIRKQALSDNFKLIINKPNFEFFLLLHFMMPEDAAKVKPKDYITEINSHIEAVNLSNKNDKGFTDSMKISPYSKKKYVARNCFGGLFTFNPELIEVVAELDIDTSAGRYSEMPELARRIKEIYQNKL